MEDRKRAFVDDPTSPSSPAPKKRVLTSGEGSPIAVAADNREIDVELFQKEAIFRQMNQYRREKERAEQKIVDLERKRDMAEAALAAVETTWNQLLNVMLERVNPLSDLRQGSESLVQLERHATANEVTVHLQASLEERLRSTEHLLNSLVQLASSSQGPEITDWQERARQARVQADARSNELQISNARLQEALQELAHYKEALSAAEKRAERAKSRSVLSTERKATKAKEEAAPAEPAEEIKPKVEEAAVTLAALPQANGHLFDEDSLNWQTKAIKRENDLQQAAEERLKLVEEVRRLKDRLNALSSEDVEKSETYETLYSEALDWKHRAEAAISQLDRLQRELDSLRDGQAEFKAKIEADAKVKTDKLELEIEKKDHDLNRLREQRDAVTSENLKYRNREAEKFRSITELKTLTAAQEERITVLQSEVTRLRAKVASGVGDEDLLAIILGAGSDVLTHTNVYSQLKEARKQLAVMEQRAQAGAMSAEQLQKLRKYEVIFGADSASHDLRSMAARLEGKEEELLVARLRLKEEEAATNSLYSEVDRLSAAWESLVQQSKSKVFDLAGMEDRLNRMNTEKAKADNKYFAAMRQKEAQDTERKNMLRNVEKQAKVIERLSESEKSLNAQMATQDKEMSISKRIVHKHFDKIMELENAVKATQRQHKDSEKRIAELHSQAKERERLIEKRKDEMRKLEEDAAVARKEAERAIARTKVVSSGTGVESAEVQALQNENAKMMEILRCSTCKLRMRSHVLIKCMHSFCKDCIEARVSTRQRKCPACNLPFAQSEMQQLFFQ